MVSGFYIILRTGLPGSSVYTRFRRRCGSGLWSKVMLAIPYADGCGEIRAIDYRHVKAHQDGG
jgi:hypothetical protein